MKPLRKTSLTLPFWNIPSSEKKSNKKRRCSMPAVSFSPKVKYLDSDGESLSSSLPSNSSEPSLHELNEELDKVRSPLAGSSPLDHIGSPLSEESLEELRHLDELGQTLENTFKEVESIDAYVQKLRTQFDSDMLSEHRFMSCICSAKLARAACCQRQINAWNVLKHELVDFCCHHQNHFHDHNDHHHSHHSDSDDNNDDSASNLSHDEEMEDLLHQLNKMSTFQRIKDRLDPKGDAKSFVEHWILQSDQSDAATCAEEN